MKVRAYELLIGDIIYKFSRKYRLFRIEGGQFVFYIWCGSRWQHDSLRIGVNSKEWVNLVSRKPVSK